MPKPIKFIDNLPLLKRLYAIDAVVLSATVFFVFFAHYLGLDTDTHGLIVFVSIPYLLITPLMAIVLCAVAAILYEKHKMKSPGLITLLLIFLTAGFLTSVLPVQHWVARHTIADKEAKKCQAGKYSDRNTIGPYDADFKEFDFATKPNGLIYSCRWGSFLDNWEGPVYYPFSGQIQGSNIPDDLRAFDGDGVRYCTRINREWLWCNAT